MNLLPLLLRQKKYESPALFGLLPFLYGLIDSLLDCMGFCMYKEKAFVNT